MRPAVGRKRITLGARTLSYLAAGDATAGRLVIFLHAFPLGADMWAPQLRALPAGWAAAAPDFRGFGGSTPDPDVTARAGASLDDYADDVVALMDELGATSAALCGSSMGGYAALAILRRAPGRVSGLLLADTRATADTDAARASRVATLTLLDQGGHAAVAADMRARLVGPTTKAERPAVGDAIDRMLERATTAGIGFAVSRMMNRPDRTAALAGFPGPVCVAVGDEDQLTPPAEAAAMAALVPGAALVVVPQAGHLSNLEAPEAFNAAMRGWLHAVVHPSSVEAEASTSTSNPRPGFGTPGLP